METMPLDERPECVPHTGTRELWTLLSSDNEFPLAGNSNVFFLLLSNAKGLRERLIGSAWPIRENLTVKAWLWCHL